MNEEEEGEEDVETKRINQYTLYLLPPNKVHPITSSLLYFHTTQTQRQHCQCNELFDHAWRKKTITCFDKKHKKHKNYDGTQRCKILVKNL